MAPRKPQCSQPLKCSRLSGDLHRSTTRDRITGTTAGIIARLMFLRQIGSSFWDADWDLRILVGYGGSGCALLVSLIERPVSGFLRISYRFATDATPLL